MNVTIGNISGEIVRAAGSRKEKDAKAATRKDKRNDPARAEREKIRQHGYDARKLTEAVTNAEKRLEALRLEFSELDAKSIELEDKAFREGKVQLSARDVEWKRAKTRSLIDRAVQEIAKAKAALNAHNGVTDGEGDDESSDVHSDAPRRGRPPKVPV